MGSMRKGKRKRRRERGADPDRVLSGATRLDVRSLLTLIHEVNPTERGLSRSDEVHRYEVKSRLQSLLVRDFEAELSVELDPAQPGVVAIQHRYGGGDGCHAILDELDDDVRAALRRRFDEQAWGPDDQDASPVAGDEPEARVDPAAADSLEALLEAAQAQLEAYAYDEARQTLETAFEVGRGATAAARPLLALLVELLGMDGAALALEPRLGREARQDPEVRALVALASARSGEMAAAKRWLRSVADEERIVEVQAALADRALTEGDAGQAGAALVVIRGIDPAGPHVLRIERAIAAIGEQERAPLEAQLAELVADGEAERARRLADRILSRWPDSAPARRTLRRLERESRTRRLAAHRAAADRAEGEGAMDRALEQVQAAWAVCDDAAERERLERRASALRDALKEAEEAARVAAVVAEVGGADRAGALSRYLELEPRLRRAVTERIDGAEPVAALLGWLDVIDPSAGRRAREAVAAVLALDEAREALSFGDAAAAGERLEPYRSILKKVGEAKRVGEEAAAWLARERRERSEAALAAARGALAGGDHEGARGMLAAIDRDVLGGEDVNAIELLERDVAIAGKVATLAARFEGARAAEDLVGARRVADELGRLDHEAASTWQERADALRAALVQAWRIETVSVDGSLRLWGRGYLRGDGVPAIALTAEGDFVDVTIIGRWLWLSRRSRDGMVRAFQMRLPEKLGMPVATLVVDDRVWLLGATAWLLCLSLPDGTPMVWESYADFVDEGCKLEGGAVTLDGEGRYLWLNLTNEDHRSHLVVVDRRHRRERSRIGDDAFMPMVLPGAVRDHGGAHMIFSTDLSRDLSIRDRRGQRAREINPPAALRTQTLALRKDRNAFYALGPDRELSYEDGDVPLELVAVDERGRPGERFVLEDSHYELVHCLASSRASDLAFVAWARSQQERQLAAFRSSDDGRRLQELYRVDCERGDSLVQDARGEHVALVRFEPEPEVYALTDEAPEIAPSSGESVPWLPHFSWPFFCSEMRLEGVESGIGPCTQLVAGRGPALVAVVARYERDHADDAVALADMVLALRARANREPASELLERSLERHPEAVALRALRVIVDAAADRWEQVAAASEELEALAAYEPVAGHLHHVIGIAAFRRGDVEEARRVWEAGPEGGCRLDDLATFAAAIASDSEQESPTVGPATAGSEAARVAWAIRQADARLDAGDAEGALRAVDQPAVRVYAEVQSLARAVQAHLHLEPRTASERVAKTAALASLASMNRALGFSRGTHLPLPGHTWEQERLVELAERAEAWLG